MASDNVTQSDVSAAAEAIAGRGEPPTNERVRAALGRGSYSTISPLLREWKLARDQADPASLAEAAAGELTGALARLIEPIRTQAREEIDAVRDEARRRTEALEAELETRLREAQGRAEAAEVRARELDIENRTLKAANAQWQEIAAAVEGLEGSLGEQVRESRAAQIAALDQLGADLRRGLVALPSQLRAVEARLTDAHASLHATIDERLAALTTTSAETNETLAALATGTAAGQQRLEAAIGETQALAGELGQRLAGLEHAQSRRGRALTGALKANRRALQALEHPQYAAAKRAPDGGPSRRARRGAKPLPLVDRRQRLMLRLRRMPGSW